MSQMSEYERRRAENIARNRAKLAELGLTEDVAALGIESVADKKARPTKVEKKRKATSDQDHGNPAKTARTRVAQTVATRRSQRNVGKKIDYAAKHILPDPSPARVMSGLKDGINDDGPMGRESGKRVHNPKTYGAIPGIAVGTWWETREGCSVDAVHAPWVAGISPGPRGAYSISLSGGYEDDVDLGQSFTYTGSGGRDLKGTKTAPKNLRTAPQSSDQTFEKSSNKALLTSSETKKPVRVIRGYKLKSAYAPVEGYRYDGLYTVEKAWLEKGESGFLVCKFAFKRLPRQPPLHKKNTGDSEQEA